MPFVLIIIGLILVITGIKNTQGTLGQLLVNDFTGAGNFFYWIAAIIAVGAIGYVNELRTVSRALLGLILVVLFLSNKGFFGQFTSQLQSGTAQAAPSNEPSGAQAGGSSSSGASGGIPGLSDITNLLGSGGGGSGGKVGGSVDDLTDGLI